MDQFIYNIKENRLWLNGQEIKTGDLNEKHQPYFVLGPENHWLKFQEGLRTVFYKRVNPDGTIKHYEKELKIDWKEGQIDFFFTVTDEVRCWPYVGWTRVRFDRKWKKKLMRENNFYI